MSRSAYFLNGIYDRGCISPLESHGNFSTPLIINKSGD